MKGFSKVRSFSISSVQFFNGASSMATIGSRAWTSLKTGSCNCVRSNVSMVFKESRSRVVAVTALGASTMPSMKSFVVLAAESASAVTLMIAMGSGISRKETGAADGS